MKARITKIIQQLFEDKEYKFEVYIRIKDSMILKKMILFEGNPNSGSDDENFKKCVQDSIEEAIKNKFIDENIEYDLAENIADNQKKFYIIKQDDSYEPFSMIKNSVAPINKFSMDERDNAAGIFLKFKRRNLSLWAYQHIYPTAIPNKRNTSFLSLQQGDSFIGMDKPMFPIAKKVDILVIGDEIITSNITLMERSFGFQGFIKRHANKTIENITELGLVTNVDKLTDYIERSKPKYAKKMMRIKNSKVLKMSSEDLLKRVQTLPRWNGKFEIEDEHIVLNTYSHVESLIELLDETYTRSDVTGEEYKTDVKKWVGPPIALKRQVKQELT
ncbi:DUF4868 domain-containing protein [Clostridium sp. UBA3887]|uniref:DUF4868 domain-containing protein n=1 Tax=Clostridium sp. UBA3887 TaxID=1946356 RepID=UPI0032163B0E